MTVKDYYDEIADEYDSLRYGTNYYHHVAQLELRFIQEYLKNGLCLEVGVGTGRVTKLLVNHFKEVRAVDISSRMLERLRANLPECKKLKTEILNIYELSKIKDYGNFDNVICLRLLPHTKDPLAALKKLRGAVVLDGVVIIDLWNTWGFRAILKRLHLRRSAVYTSYNTVRQMKAIIDEAGLSIMARKGFGFPPFKGCLPLEKTSLSWLNYFAQRIIWVCCPQI
jgi:SAM-dependent methyltransferase